MTSMDTMDDENEEKDVELVTLITDVLQKNGLLNHVKAQLRAGVFAAMEKEDLKTRPQLTEKIKQLMLSKEGRVCFTVVYDFLKFLNLEFTLKVFEPEVSCGDDLNPLENKEMADFLPISQDKNKPLLFSVIEGLVANQSSDKLKPENNNWDFKSPDELHKGNNNEDSNNSEESATFSSTSSGINKEEIHGFNKKPSIWNTAAKEEKLSTDGKVSKLFPNSLTSLSDLPPLSSIKPSLVSLKDNYNVDEEPFEPFLDTCLKVSPSTPKHDSSEEADSSQTANNTEDILKDLSIEGSEESENDATRELTVSQSSGKSNDFVQSV